MALSIEVNLTKALELLYWRTAKRPVECPQIYDKLQGHIKNEICPQCSHKEFCQLISTARIAAKQEARAQRMGLG